MSRHLIALPLAAAVLLAGGFAARADPPGRVGRLSFIEGTVSFHDVGQDQWSAAVLNYPVTSGASFWTEPNARAEIQVGGAELRLDQSTEIDIVRLDDGGTDLHVGQGVVNVHLHTLPPGGIHVVTPHSEADLLVAGTYRIDAGAARDAGLPERVQIVVLEGRARINEPRADLDIQPGESAVVGGDPVTFTLVEASPTAFDDWALQRDRREVVSVTARYVGVDVTGYEDLDRNGEWRNTTATGAVWYPTSTPAGWAPYRYGHWAFVQPWGWTWVDDAAWGFAPFHYGRWVNDSHGWGWHPGERVERPVYAPALVAFVGGAGWGVSISTGNAPAVGWIPLGPSEVFHPYYTASQDYARNVNRSSVSRTEVNRITVTNVTNIQNITTVNNYANRQAATVVPSADFTRAAPVQRASLAVPKEQLGQAAITGRVDHLQPTAAARAGMARPQPGVAPSNAAPVSIAATIVKGPVVAPSAPRAGTPVVAEVPVLPAPGPAHEMKRIPVVVTPGRVPPVVAPRAVTPHVAPMPVVPAAPVVPPPPTAGGAAIPARPAVPVSPHQASPATPAPPPAPAPTAQTGRMPQAVQPTRQAPVVAPPTVPHPVQQTRIAPGPNGWVRTPAAAPPAPAPHAVAPPGAPSPQARPVPPAAAPKPGINGADEPNRKP